MTRLIFILLTLVNFTYGQTYVLSDTAFVSFLKKNYPQTLNSNNELILANAALVKGTFRCENSKISNVDGIQFFTGLTSLYLNNNQLTWLPYMSGLKSLENLEVNDNQLQSISDLSPLINLVHLSLDNNKLQVLPDLSKNLKLNFLSAHHNSLDSIPRLKYLQNLGFLQVAYNEITQLDGIENLPYLTYIYAWKNKITALPNLTNMTNLIYLDVSYNQIKSLPVFAQKDSLRTFFINDNLLSALNEDFSQCPKVQKVRMYNNDALSFKQIQIFQNKSGYDTIFKFNPQRIKKVAVPKNIIENQELVLSTGIDRGVSGVYYQWYKNGVWYKTVSNDSLQIRNTSLLDSGKYYCIIGHEMFKNIQFKTDTFVVKITSCLDTQNIKINTTSILCNKMGTVSISDISVPKKAYSYTLIAASGKKYTATVESTISNLSETTYTVQVKDAYACIKELPAKLVLEQTPCLEVLLYPDGTENNAYYFEDAGLWNVFNKRGQTVNHFSGPYTWHGDAQNTQKLPPGFYVAENTETHKRIGFTILY